MDNIKDIIAKRIAMEMKDGDLVNLGIPSLVANYIAEDCKVYLQSENGSLDLVH